MANYQKISKNIQKLTINNLNSPDTQVEWINITNAGKNELEFLRKQYNFSISHLQPSSAKMIAQRPVVEKWDGYIFMILHYPIRQGDRIVSAEVDFFIGHGFLVTLHNNNLEALNNFFSFAKKEEKSTITYSHESSIMLLYEILERLMANCLLILDTTAADISTIEEMIFDERKQKHAISHILNLRRNITNFRKVMQSHKNILKILMDLESESIEKQTIKTSYINLIDYSKRIWEFLENQKEMVEIFYDTNESILNNRLNDIMKTLTIFSVIVFPLTLLAAVFGMNTVNGMPFMDSANGFWIIIFIMLLGSFGMILFFWKKKWL